MGRQSLVQQHPEKRNYVRAPFKTPIIVEDLNGGYIYRARMINYSKRGIFIETDVGLEPGDEIYIGIEESPSQLSTDATRSYRARVIWQKTLKNSFFNFGYGVIIISGQNKNSQGRKDRNRQELRKYPRKPYPKMVFFTSQNRYYRGSIGNISRGGIFIKTDDIFHIGQIIKLVIPETKIDKGVMLVAEVVRLDEIGVGVKFKAVLKAKSALNINLAN
jgi:Tfp pilus assembly protein PilZ